MRRTWRFARMCLAGLIFFGVWCAWYFWQQSPLWTIPSEEIVGFDLQKQLLYTAPRKKEVKTDLRAYDLSNGTSRSAVEITTDLPRNDAYRAWLLSPDGTKVVCCTQRDWNLDVFDVATGRRLRRWKAEELKREWAYHAIGFTPNSRQLLVQSWATTMILDIDSGELRDRFEFPEHKQGTRTTHSIRTANEIQLSPDGRYLAASVDESCSLLIDLKTKQVVGSCKFLAAAWFSPDAMLVRFLSVIGPDQSDPRQAFGIGLRGQIAIASNLHGPSKKLVQAHGRWIEMGNPETNGNFLASCNNGFATCWIEPVSFPFLEHLPQDLQNWILGRIGVKHDLHVSFWGEQNELLRHFRCRVPSDREAMFDGTSVPIALSQDGIYLVFHVGKELAVWDTRHPRPWPFWLLAASLSSFAVWIAWPRRRHTPATPLETSPSNPT
jgi:hypothetical protein